MLTSGGDCPGLNAVIRAIVRSAHYRAGDEVVGFRDGWRGLLDGSTVDLSVESTSGILHRGGTILGSFRSDAALLRDRPPDVGERLSSLGLDGLIAIGGDGTLRVAANLLQSGLSLIGVPKTIDNDIGGTDVTFGFDTAVQIATDAIDRLHTTAESHNRVLIVEVMGRHSGWIALHAGLAGGADVILVPERSVDIRDLAGRILERAKRGRRFSLVVVAEGVTLVERNRHVRTGRAEGHGRLGGIAHTLERDLEALTGHEARALVLGHVQRGGTPTASTGSCRPVSGARSRGRTRTTLGTMPAWRGHRIRLVPLEAALARP